MFDIFNKYLYKKRGIYIAEIGLNHNGDPQMAAAMIESAALAGASAVKFQTIVPELLNSVYTSSLLNSGSELRPDYETIGFFKRSVLAFEDYVSLKALAGKLGLIFFSAPFDFDSLEMLQKLGINLYKIASSEVTNIRLIKKIAQTGKPAIMSTGISSNSEIAAAIDAFKTAGGEKLTLLHCVSTYPASAEHINLNRILSLKREFGFEVGFSDHTKGLKAAVIAAAIGVRIFEKHFTIDKDYDCPDREVSLSPDEFSAMIDEVEETILMLGDGSIDCGESEKGIARAARRSLFANRDIKSGSIVSEDDIVALRPGTGIPVSAIDSLIGRRVKADIAKDSILRTDYFE